jgi:hypothetical protein
MAGVCVVAALICPREEDVARAINPVAKRNVEIRKHGFERVLSLMIKPLEDDTRILG